MELGIPGFAGITDVCLKCKNFSSEIRPNTESDICKKNLNSSVGYLIYITTYF